MMAVLTIMTIAALNINTINQLDLETATRMAVYQTLEQRYDTSTIPVIRVKNEDGSYKQPSEADTSNNEYVVGDYVYKDFKITNDETLVEMFNENLSMLLKKQDFVVAKIIAANYDEGLLSVNVSYTYNNMGFQRTIDTTQTVINEELSSVKPNDPISIEAQDYFYATLYTDGTLTISSKEILPEDGKTVQTACKKITPSKNQQIGSSYVKTVKFLDAISLTSCQSLFDGCSNLIEIQNIDNLITANCTNMRRMFASCSNLTSLDLSNIDTKNCTNFSEMFYGCKNLTTIDLSKFDTKNVLTMNAMFGDCNNLKKINLTNFNTSNCKDLGYMFEYCRSLTELDLNNFDTSKVTYMSGLVYDCQKLKKLDISNKFTINTSTSITSFFYNCLDSSFTVNTSSTTKDSFRAKATESAISYVKNWIIK